MMALIDKRSFKNIRVKRNGVVGRAHEKIQLRLGRPVRTDYTRSSVSNGPL